MKEIINSDQMTRTIKRMSHEIIERNNDLSNVILVAILKKGLPLANMIAKNIKEFSGVTIKVFALDISNYRDDGVMKTNDTLVADITNKDVIIVDDVLFTGRSVRSALNALYQNGRASKFSLAVLIDRGHRELPIRPDYVGKNVPTSKSEKVVVDFNEMNVTVVSNN